MDDDLNFLEDDDDIVEENSDCFWNILIVDDEADVHIATKFALTDIRINNCKIKWHDAYSGRECVDYLTENAERVDLILLDVIMETPTAGIQAARDIRSLTRTRNIPIIILRSGQTGNFGDSDILANSDINSFIPKSKATRDVLKSLFESYLK
jgi:CheY-like chemotaxis protein